MAYGVTFEGKFVFETREELQAGVQALLAEGGFDESDFTVDGLTVVFDFDGSASGDNYDDMVIGLEDMAPHAIGGTVRHEIAGDGSDWMFASRDLGLSAELSKMMRFVIGEDFEQVEFSRDEVTAAHLEEAPRAYELLTTWQQRSCWVQLFQDHLSEHTRSAMLDFLRAPAVESDDSIWMSKVVALCHLDHSHDSFDRYLSLGNAEVEALAASRLGESST